MDERRAWATASDGHDHVEAWPATTTPEADGPVWGIPVPEREDARNAAGLPTARAVRARIWELRRQLGDGPRWGEEAERLDMAEEDLRLGFVHSARRRTELVQAAVWSLQARNSAPASGPGRRTWWSRVTQGTWIALALYAAWVAAGAWLAVTFTPADSGRVMAILAVMLAPLCVGCFGFLDGTGPIRPRSNWHGDVF